LLHTILVFGAATAVALLTVWLSEVALRRALRRHRRLVNSLQRSCHRPWATTLLISANLAALSGLHSSAAEVAYHVLRVLLIGSVAWLVVKVLLIAEDAAFRRFRIDVPENRRARRARTQINILRRVTAAVVTILAIAVMLTTFAPLRALGASLLASAGVAGVVVGLAAQATLTNVLAGLQLAWSDMLRYDDVVVVGNEWGRIEEITLTFVVVHLWDDRRLAVPPTYFTKTPFENWSRHETRVLGSVVLHLDYRAPVAAVRTETRRLLDASPSGIDGNGFCRWSTRHLPR
jgi:small-conductance mechanosensitive channel